METSLGKGSSDHTVTCPGNILGDISRLEVLVGGERAGNNSAEIVNEAADICRRLFQGGVMDIRTYRELIDELAETQRHLRVLQRQKSKISNGNSLSFTN
ncbi:hypothetical protein ACJMK2_033343 [Sinanodonta woodiana]|uniref:Uncharacterized protein n=1 Tax=Sinanodonta woodiana TaxID=1069815 RepID=A0ABD3WN24_SINWO